MRRLVAFALLLVACSRQPPEVVDEVTRRTAYVRALSEREGHLDAWSLNPRADLSFEEGMSSPTFLDEDDAVRWMNRVARFRVRGTTDMVFELRGKILIHDGSMPPRLALFVDGEHVESKLVDADGSFEIRTVVKKETIVDWVDVYATFSNLPGLEIVQLKWVGWEPGSS